MRQRDLGLRNGGVAPRGLSLFFRFETTQCPWICIGAVETDLFASIGAARSSGARRAIRIDRPRVSCALMRRTGRCKVQFARGGRRRCRGPGQRSSNLPPSVSWGRRCSHYADTDVSLVWMPAAGIGDRLTGRVCEQAHQHFVEGIKRAGEFNDGDDGAVPSGNSPVMQRAGSCS